MLSQVLIYPVFSECKDYTLDPYWQEIFLNCARNKFPKNMKYNNKNNSVSIKIPGTKKIEIVELPENHVDIFQLMMELFKDKLGMKSSRDIQVQNSEIQEIKEQSVIEADCEWKRLKPRMLKDELIMNYALSLSEKYELSDSDLKNLLTTIHLGFQFKRLTAEHIDYSNGVINNISGLVFDSENRRFEITNEPKSSSKNDKNGKSQEIWKDVDKFLRDYRSRKIK